MDCPVFFKSIPYFIISRMGKAIRTSNCVRTLHIHRIDRNESPLKNSGKVAVGVFRDSKILRTPMYSLWCIALSFLRQLSFLVLSRPTFQSIVYCQETSCDGGITYNSTCYKVHREKVNWFTAVNRCLSNNGSLAVFDDNILTYFAPTLLTEGHVWIGLIKSWWTWLDAGLYLWQWHQL